ncbi:ketopantoate reductase family protein [Herbiconiux sp. SYSU D00978]|uniref:ketopantoate reductase family protein n=1 Tax=Herbiconiux sp. SYSU D00978 TaxID=2812562 RepID=UPI001A9649C8|nr:2-dehydropantoate 2-reductase [Herbiconiux sp. SYSU D00978]
MTTRIAVLGAGAVGGTLAALLDRAGHEVDVTARGAHLDAIGVDGLRLTGGWGEHVARVQASPALERAPRLAIVATKATDAAGALSDNAALLSGVPLLVVQNGLGALTVSEPVLPGATVVGGLAMFAARISGPGLVEVTAPAVTYLGSRLPGAAASVARLLGDAVPVELVDDFEAAQFTKLVVNQVNALPAVTGLSVQQVHAHPGLVRLVAESIREAARVGIARGIRFVPMGVMDDAVLRRLVAAPLEEAVDVPRAMARGMGDVPNEASTLQSIRRGRPTEVDALGGAVVALGDEARVPAPVTAAIVGLVHEVERTGAFLSPGEVLARVPLP